MNRDKNYSDIRKEYLFKTFDRQDLEANPVQQFKNWLSEAIGHHLPEPTAMVLSTVSNDLKPSSRIVLLKYIEKNEFIFFTNYNSKKGIHLEYNRNACLLFFWEKFHRQVRIEGNVKKVSKDISENYFNKRPLESKISATISEQSKVIPNRDYLENLRQNLVSETNKITRPENWGGYALTPNLFEFWQGREGRLHDRFEYTLHNNKWEHHRLAP